MRNQKYLVSKILTVEVQATDAADALDKGSDMIHNGANHITLDWQVEEIRKGAKIAHTSLKER